MIGAVMPLPADLNSAVVPSEGPRSTVYGPVRSWRLGSSLGIDLLYSTSICSFRCVYCQLGKIEIPTIARQQWVSTATVVADLEASPWQKADVITFSGNGEPTLASNLGECLRAVKERTDKPLVVLTNGTLLSDPQVRADLQAADRVYVKLDAASNQGLKIVDNPVAGVTIEGIVAGAMQFREEYQGFLAIQSMIMPMNLSEIDGICELIRQLRPDEVQLNTPLRPVPRAWYPESRGNHQGHAPFPESYLKVLTPTEAAVLEAQIRERVGVRVVSVYQPAKDEP